MIKQTFSYNQTSARLELEGLPDISIGQSEGTIGIISSWKLNLIGFPQLEGKRDHLEALMSVVFPYARYCMSSIQKDFGGTTSPVSINSCDTNHEITLRSSNPGVEPLSIVIDDAQLSDLVRCLDLLKHDKRVNINWKIPSYKPLRIREVSETKPFMERVLPAFLGFSTFIIASSLLVILPNSTINDSGFVKESISTPNK